MDKFELFETSLDHSKEVWTNLFFKFYNFFQFFQKFSKFTIFFQMFQNFEAQRFSRGLTWTEVSKKLNVPVPPGPPLDQQYMLTSLAAGNKFNQGQKILNLQVFRKINSLAHHTKRNCDGLKHLVQSPWGSSILKNLVSREKIEKGGLFQFRAISRHAWRETTTLN